MMVYSFSRQPASGRPSSRRAGSTGLGGNGMASMLGRHAGA
jgi:hypothetical protein